MNGAFDAGLAMIEPLIAESEQALEDTTLTPYMRAVELRSDDEQAAAQRRVWVAVDADNVPRPDVVCVRLEGTFERVGALRSDTLGVLHELRATLRREIKHDPKLPVDLESRLFSYLDELNARRRKSKSTDREPPPPAETP
jgi:hypothetical protein